MSQLSAGTCLRLHNAQAGDEDLFNSGHTVQFLSIKQVTPATSGNNAVVERYRIIISDGEHFLQAMLATQLNHMVKENSIGKNSIAVIDKLTCNFVQGKRLIIILALQVVSTDEEKIGNPTAITTAAPEQQQQARTTPAVPAKSGRPVFPIEGLSPYQNNWTIRARVTQKSDIKTWSNQRGEGKLFNVTLMDDTGEIRGTGFNQVVDDLYSRLEENKVYYISKARVNLAKKKFSNLANDYELSFEKNTEIEECHETANIPQVKYNFIPLSDLETLAKDSVCDVIGVVKERADLSTIISKASSREITKRELTLVDKSEFSVRLTLWGKQAEDYNADDNAIIACKGVKVGDFGGRSLSMFSSSTMSVNPENEDAFQLRGWFDAIGSGKSFQSHQNAAGSGGAMGGGFNRTEIRDLMDVKQNQLGEDERVDFFSARATVMHIKSDNMWYPACPSQGCNKKVTDVGGSWRCEKCDKSFDKPEHRYIMTMAVADWSCQAWLHGFNDTGVAVFGMPADELYEIKENDEARFNNILQKSTCGTFNFSCKAKSDTFNDRSRVRYGINRIATLNFREEAGYLRDLLAGPWGQS
ncbi:replication factor-a protein [Athelia psychrophila]|uniref:Replication protein A subunit n=1 Tax=Athelia psychrophila TaxID=1759441 RepID=A0A166GJ41_9AGAM|nr:replication factor-a protein [Fibularhizoctonia sp. CBS 109695]